MKFRHIGIVPINIKNSLNFYMKLGFVIIKEQIEERHYINNLLNINAKRVKTYKLGFNGCIILELLEYDLPIIKRDNTVLSQGITHFALSVEDVEDIFLKYKSSIEFLSEPLLTPDGYAKVVYCKDPDGNFLELVELL